MAKEKFGIAVAEDTAQEIDKLVDECEDLGASRSEIVEAILTAYIQSDTDHLEQVRELIIRRRKGNI
jgi:metal-responsive CopG/Arc/MetJ family transcriptional regulator